MQASEGARAAFEGLAISSDMLPVEFDEELSLFAAVDSSESAEASVLGLLQRLRQAGGGGLESIAASLQRCEDVLSQRVAKTLVKPDCDTRPGGEKETQQAQALRPGEAEAQSLRGRRARRLVLDALRAPSR